MNNRVGSCVVRSRWIYLIALLLILTDRSFADNNQIQIDVTQDGNVVTLTAVLENCTEATITIKAKLKNMTSSERMPFTVDAAGRTKFELVRFTIKDPDKDWHYDFHFDWKAGRRLQGKPQEYIYSLPYRNGPFKIIQGSHGLFSHYKGSQDEEAIDWAMPIGTKIYPARPGIVVALRQDSNSGGPDPKYKGDHNYVILMHDDGTFAEYAHLKQNGVLAHLGDHVDLNQPIALSGDTGWTTAPHLHFDVFYTINGTTRKTLPVQFKSRAGDIIKPKEGHAY